jgi:hypothetical protein
VLAITNKGLVTLVVVNLFAALFAVWTGWLWLFVHAVAIARIRLAAILAINLGAAVRTIAVSHRQHLGGNAEAFHARRTNRPRRAYRTNWSGRAGGTR